MLFTSDGVVVVDSEGNACSMVHSANSLPWGSGIFVQGSALPNAASVQPTITIATQPGERIPGPIQELLGVINDNGGQESLLMALSTIGAGLHEYTTALLPLLLSMGQDPKAAVDGSFWCGPDLQNPMASRVALNSISVELIAQVEAMGQPLAVVDTPVGIEGWPVVILQPTSNGLFGAATQAGNGYVEGL